MCICVFAFVFVFLHPRWSLLCMLPQPCYAPPCCVICAASVIHLHTLTWHHFMPSHWENVSVTILITSSKILCILIWDFGDLINWWDIMHSYKYQRWNPHRWLQEELFTLRCHTVREEVLTQISPLSVESVTTVCYNRCSINNWEDLTNLMQLMQQTFTKF